MIRTGLMTAVGRKPYVTACELLHQGESKLELEEDAAPSRSARPGLPGLAPARAPGARSVCPQRPKPTPKMVKATGFPKRLAGTFPKVYGLSLKSILSLLSQAYGNRKSSGAQPPH